MRPVGKAVVLLLFLGACSATIGGSPIDPGSDTDDDPSDGFDGADAGPMDPMDPMDPPGPACQNGTCEASENCGSCPADCGVCPAGCNDGTCNGNESCESCPADCGFCPSECWDDVCEGAETCGNCPYDCGSCVALPASLLPTIQAFRGDYPTPMSPAQLGELLNRVAWQHRAEGWGLLRKDGGTRCPTPIGPETSCDVLVHQPTAWHWDVIIAAGDESTPGWQDVGPCILGPKSGCEMARFLAPVAP